MKDNGTYYVMYNTLGAGKRQSSIAYSTDLIHWTPAYNYARFPGGTDPSDWNYNMFCGHMFKYEDLYYVIFPGQDSSHDYAKFGLYASHSPLFPENDTEFKGIVMIGDKTGWDAGDMDTPWIVPFNNVMHMYYAACGSCWSQTGLAILNDIPQALTGAYPPGNYIDTNRAATASLQIMPPAGWQKSLAGYKKSNGQNFEITLTPSVSGRATVLKDTNATCHWNYIRISLAREGARYRHGSEPIIPIRVIMIFTYMGIPVEAGAGSRPGLPMGIFHYWTAGAFVDTCRALFRQYLVQAPGGVRHCRRYL